MTHAHWVTIGKVIGGQHGKKLSQAVARSTVTDARDIVIVDTQIPGFEFRVRRSGAKIWTYRYRNPEGRQRRYIMGRFPGVSATAPRGGWR